MKRFVCLVILAVPSISYAGEKPAVVLKHEGWVAAVAFAPDGKTLASAGADNVVRLWEVGTWKPKGVLKGHTDCVCTLAFSSRGEILATGSFDGVVKMWDLEKLTAVGGLKQKGVVTSLLVETGGYTGYIVTGGIDGTVRMDPASGYKRSLVQHKSWVNSLAVHQSGAASGSSDGTVALITDSKDGKIGKPVFLEAGAGEVRCVAFSPDGKLLAAGNRYHTVRVWDVATRKEVKTLAGHMSDVWSIAFSPDGKTLAAADTDWKKPSKVKLWDTTTWKERGSIDVPGEILSIAYSPKGDWLAVGSWDKSVRVFQIKAP